MEEQALQTNTEYQMSVVEDTADAKFPDTRCIYHLFEEQARRTPDRVAVVCGDEQITYKELDEKSNRFGRYLHSRGVKSEQLAGICLERSIDTIISILSILKAGGAYVPIDPDYPDDRIAFMLEDSQCRVLITQAAVAARLPATSAEIICIDEMTEAIERESSVPLAPDVTPDNLAYVIYTSGSTGRPKGVMIENRNVVRLLFNDQFQFDFSENDVWSIFHSFCFDFSVWEMYGALLFGGKAVIVPRQATRDPHAFIDIVLKERVTVINQTPSAFYSLAPYLIQASDRTRFLRYVIFGGEKLNPSKLREVKYSLPQVIFVNMYGITETTVHVTYKEITGREITEGFSNIGKPIPTLKAYIFDENMQLVPRGIEGELCVGGQGVARGYLNREELTRAKFTPNPLCPDEIIYRSGDLACMHENGDLEYFGRMDNQVQLRGYRIELGEIESVVAATEEIKDCVVTIDETSNGDSRILAYVIPERKCVSIQGLKKSIAKKLPDYMIPTFFIEVDAFPLTDNGKLDLKMLPSPDIDHIAGSDCSAPATGTERVMMELWSEILGIETDKLGREYNFFEIGGHSLTAIRLLSQIRKRFKKEVTIHHIYANPELDRLCRVITAAEDIREEALSEIGDETPRKGLHPIKSTQLAYWLGTFLFKFEISNVCEVYRLEGIFDFELFQTALNKVAGRHDALWFKFSNRKPLVHIETPEPYAGEYIDWNDESVHEGHDHLSDFIIQKMHDPFDLSKVPLLRVTVIKKEPGDHLLLVSLPHIISDITAVNTFVDEVFNEYSPPEISDQAAPPWRITSAREAIDREVEYLQGTGCGRDMNFWQEKLGDIDVLKVNRKYFFPRRKKGASNQKLITKIALNEPTMAALHRLSARSNASVQVIILAIIHATLHTLSEQRDISTMMVYDLSGMSPYPPAMQLNANMLTVPSRFAPDTSYLGLISNLRAFLVEALSHARLPGSIMSSIPVASALKHRPLLTRCLRATGRFYAWRYGKSKATREDLVSYIFYILGTIVLGLKNIGRKKEDRTRQPAVLFNVLPSFYENRELWSNGQLKVTTIGDREWVMHPGVFEENSPFQDARLLNFDLLRDDNDDACLYVWGGDLNPRGFTVLQEAFHTHLHAIREDPTQTVLTDPTEVEVVADRQGALPMRDNAWQQ